MQFFDGKLNFEQMAASPVAVVSEGTPLRQAAERSDLECHQHVLVVDADGSLLGFIPCDEILKHTAISGRDERRRWNDMPVESLLPTKLDAPSAEPTLRTDGTIDCSPIFEDGNLVGLITGGDALISWNRVAPLLNRATSDPVTGLPNRYGFERRLHEELNRARRLHSSVAVVLSDVDHFKNVNDTHGHTTGDAMLRAMATCLNDSLRSYDFAARFGGDEFAAICFGCRPGEIDIPLRRIQSRVQSVAVDGVNQPLTISLGAAVAFPCEDGWNAIDLINAADECLYRAKAAGRNCSYFAELHDGNTDVTPACVGEKSPTENTADGYTDDVSVDLLQPAIGSEACQQSLRENKLTEAQRPERVAVLDAVASLR